MRSRSASPENSLVGDHEDVGLPRARGDVGHDVLEGPVAREPPELGEDVPLPQPAGLLLGVRRDDQLVDVLEREHVLDGGDRAALEHVAVRGDPGRAERGHHPVDAPSRRRAPRVAVDDVAGARLVDRRDHDRRDRPLIRAAPNRVEQLVPGERLVRDDEHALPSRSRSHVGLLQRSALEDGVPRSRDPVLVRAAHDLRDLVEVEDRRR